MTVSHERSHFAARRFDADIDEVDELIMVLFNDTFRPEGDNQFETRCCRDLYLVTRIKRNTKHYLL